MAYFAWSRILVGAEVDPKTGIAAKHEYVQPGAEVTPESLHVSQEGFDEYVTSGAVREYEYPDVPENYQDSPLNFFRDRMRRIASELEAVSGAGGVHFGIAQRELSGKVAPFVDPETGKAVNTSESEPAASPAGEHTPGTVQV